MTAYSWVEPFDTVDPAKWKTPGWGSLPLAVGGGKIKLQEIAGNSCHMCHVPFGAEGTIESRSVAVAFTVYPDESSAYWCMTAGNRWGAWLYLQPHLNTDGFDFIDGGAFRHYASDRSMSHITGDIQAPLSPYHVRVSTYLDPETNRIWNSMSVDGVLLFEDRLQSDTITWDAYNGIGYALPYFAISTSSNSECVVVGGLSGIYGGTREENNAFVGASGVPQSTLSAVASCAGPRMSLSGLSNLPIFYSRNSLDIPGYFDFSTQLDAIPATLYTEPFPVIDGEMIWVSTVVGYGSDPTGAINNGVFLLTTPVARFAEVPAPPPPTIYPPSGSYVGTQYAGIVAPVGFPRFTTDGSDPTGTSEIFTRGIKITDGMVLKAVTDFEGVVSAVTTVTYQHARAIPTPIPSYRESVLPLLLEQYKGDNP